MPNQQENIANFQKAGEYFLQSLDNLSAKYPVQKKIFSKFYERVDTLLANFETAPTAENLPKSQAVMELYFKNFGHALAQQGLKQAVDQLQASYHLVCNPVRVLPLDGVRRGPRVSFFIGGDAELLSQGSGSSNEHLNLDNSSVSPPVMR